MNIQVIKRDGRVELFNSDKILMAVYRAFTEVNPKIEYSASQQITEEVLGEIRDSHKSNEPIYIEEIQNLIENKLMKNKYYSVAKAFILYREKHHNIRDWVKSKKDFINRFKNSSNAANSTVDDNSNVGSKNISVLNSEIHKEDNILINRGMIMDKLKELYPSENPKQYLYDLNDHIIYKNDESTFSGAISPYCTSISMYPFLNDGIKNIGGLSASPKNLDSFCGMYINLIFAISAQYAGAVSASETLIYFNWFAAKEWGEDYYLKPDVIISTDHCNRQKTIISQIHQYFQQIVYSINQPAAARGSQSAFVNFGYFDKPFFESMFGDFYFPDGTQPKWEAVSWIQREFMQWFNAERLKCVLTFPVESFALIYKDGKFEDQETADFVAEEYARGHSFFTYISDTADSLSSCCFTGEVKPIIFSKNTWAPIRTLTFKEIYDKYKDDMLYVCSVNPISHHRTVAMAHVVKTKANSIYNIAYKGLDGRPTSINCTDDHVFPTDKGDKKARDLKVGDCLMIEDSPSSAQVMNMTYPHIISIIKSPNSSSMDVYCFEITDDSPKYFMLADGLVVHNCRLKNKIQTKEFNYTNGNIGIQTGSKSVMTLNLNRIVQRTRHLNWYENDEQLYKSIQSSIKIILERVYKYQTAYNELLWDMYNANLLPVYKAGFIDLNKQYLTIGINGLNEAAEFLGIECNDNEKYKAFCQMIFSTIKEQNEVHKTKKTVFNTECIPAESLAIKNYNWDKEDGYWVPKDRNLYASYIYIPSDTTLSPMDKMVLHGRDYIGDYLDGGSAAHINLQEHLSVAQYKHLIKFAAEKGCQYFTFNIPNSECDDCGFIAKIPMQSCPKCGSSNISLYDRVIGYLTKISNWSSGRQIEQKTRVYSNPSEV